MAKNQISKEFVRYEPSCYMRTDGRTDRRTHRGRDGPMDRHDEANSRFFAILRTRITNSKLLLIKEKITFCYEIRAKHINGLCDQNVQFLPVKLGTQRNHLTVIG
jgi:hypothetical protein